jgi:hypothetical protein
MIESSRHNLMFCHQYPTGACVTGNSEVRSLQDNVSSLILSGHLIVRSGGDGQPPGGRGLGWSGMVNSSEVLINVVINDKRKRLTRLGQTASGQGQVVLTHLAQTVHHQRRSTTSPTRVLTRNVVSLSLSLWESQSQDEPIERRVGEGGESQGRSVMDRIGVEPTGHITPRETGLTSAVVLNHERTEDVVNRDSLI